MSNPQNPGHVHPGDRKGGSPADDAFDDQRDLEARNESTMVGEEEPRDVQKAGGGTKGDSLGGAHTGRYGARPEAEGNREPKPRGRDRAT